MPGAGIDSNSGSFKTSEPLGVKLRHRKEMTIKTNSGDPDTAGRMALMGT